MWREKKKRGINGHFNPCGLFELKYFLKNVSVLYGRFFDIERGTGAFHPVSEAGGLQIPAALLLLYPLPGCCGLHWFCLHYHSYGEQRETHSYCFILFLATVACIGFTYTIILMVSKHTLTTLSSSWLLWPVFCLRYHSYGEQRETHSYYFILFLAAVAGISFIYTIILLLFSTNPSTLMHVFVVGVHACMHSCAQVFTCICECDEMHASVGLFLSQV